MDIKSFKTLTSIPAGEVAARLDAELPKDAYKAVPGAANLTDIDPNYMREVFNNVFGLCGVGWGYSYDSADLHVEVDNRPRSNGNGTRRVHVATLKRLALWYKLLDENGKVITAESIPSSGGSENDVEAYAMSGAVTNALGKAASNLGFQKSVYLGHRSHSTVGKAGGKSVEKTMPAPKPATAKPTPAATKKAAPEPAPTAADDLTRFVVQFGKRAGKTLGEIYAEGADGVKAIHFYTTMATAGDAGKDALKNAAISFLARQNGHVPASVAA